MMKIYYFILIVLKKIYSMVYWRPGGRKYIAGSSNSNLFLNKKIYYRSSFNVIYDADIASEKIYNLLV